MSGFTLDIKNFVDKAKKNPETTMRQTTFKLFSAVIKASPVDTGRFRMNWQASGGLPASGELPGLDKEGNTAVARAKDFIDKSVYWEDFTLTNNLPYAEVIEYGGYKAMFGYSSNLVGPVRPAGPSANFTGPIQPGRHNTINGYSTQAPQGVVRVNVARFNTLLEEEAAKVR
jgi:hypothetical protein